MAAETTLRVCLLEEAQLGAKFGILAFKRSRASVAREQLPLQRGAVPGGTGNE